MATDNEEPVSPRFLLEGCAIDPLLDDPGFAQLVADLARDHRITVYITDLTFQDIMAVPDDTRRAQLLGVIDAIETEQGPLPAVLASEEPKHGRLTYPGKVYPVSDEDWELLNRLKVDDRADARQALAAKWSDATLVTNDKRLIKRAMEQSIEAISTAQWRARLEDLDLVDRLND
jgi:hypothetical protein